MKSENELRADAAGRDEPNVIVMSGTKGKFKFRIFYAFIQRKKIEIVIFRSAQYSMNDL